MPDSVITCPFCALICDDLALTAGRLDTHGCQKALQGFARRRADSTPMPHRVGGQSVNLDEASAAAAKILRQAPLTLIGGLGADLEGIRALLAVADYVGAVADHGYSAPLLANAAVARESGWVAATFGEVANRADVILVVGADPSRSFPRLFERLVDNTTALYRDNAPLVAFLGLDNDTPRHGSVRARATVPPGRLLDAVALLAAIINGHKPTIGLDGLRLEDMNGLAERLKSARYAVIVWDVASFPEADAELIVDLIARVIRRLNVRTRCVGLPLTGNRHSIGAMQMMLWQSGWPMRVSFGRGAPEHDPWRFDGARLIAADEVGAIVWVAAVDDMAPPPTRVPVIALVADDVVLPKVAEVEIRVGIPAIDHVGTMVRSDTVIALPLQPAYPSARPSVAQVASAILKHLQTTGAVS